VLFAGKNAIQKIVVEDDLLKSPMYEWLRADPKISNLITERDRTAYRQKVGPDRADRPRFSRQADNATETIVIARLFNRLPKWTRASYATMRSCIRRDS
jgi:hypothetical protein